MINHLDCSIRKSADQSVLTTPRSLSQLTTSFIGSWCQGIHPALFLTLPIVQWVLSVLLKTVVSRLKITFIIFVALLVVSLICIFLFCFQVALFSFKNRYQQKFFFCSYPFLKWWAQVDSNHRPHAYQACALTTWAMRPMEWRWGGSNSWPPACKAGALPAELHPHVFRDSGFSLYLFQDTKNTELCR